jgi:hypothetical protein
MTDILPGDEDPGRALVVWRPPPVSCVRVAATVSAGGHSPEPDADPAQPPVPGALLARARRTYLTVQWTGAADRRPPCGLIRREVL